MVFKTGHTKEAGYGLVRDQYAKQGDRRVIFVACSGIGNGAGARARGEAVNKTRAVSSVLHRPSWAKPVRDRPPKQMGCDRGPNSLCWKLRDGSVVLLPLNPIEPFKTEIVYDGPSKRPNASPKGPQIGEFDHQAEGLPGRDPRAARGGP